VRTLLATLKGNAKRLLTPAARAYLKYSPLPFFKTRLCLQFVERSPGRPYSFKTVTRFGSKVTGSTLDIIQRYIYFFGAWEPNLTTWLMERLETGDVFVDVGANIGYYTLLAAQAVGERGAVIAIDASPGIFKLLERNVSINDVPNVRAVNAAVAEYLGRLPVFRAPDTNTGETTTLPMKGYELEAEVAAAPLSYILTPEEFRRARLVKIDVEGAEWPVLRGIFPSAACWRNDLEFIVEIDPESWPPEDSVEELFDRFERVGYHPYEVANDYSSLSYLRPMTTRPERIRRPAARHMDIIFSRIDAAHL
jgi:FkbM family methyltransferase